MQEFWRTVALLVSAQFHDSGVRFPPDEIVRTASATARAYEAARKDQTYADEIDAYADALELAVAVKLGRCIADNWPDDEERETAFFPPTYTNLIRQLEAA